jgi:hypothetical protein
MIAKARVILVLLSAHVLLSRVSANTSLKLVWDPSPSQVAGYKLYSKLANDSQVSTSILGNVTNAVVDNLMPGATYNFYVTAYDANNNESPPSDTVTYLVPAQSNPSSFVGADTSTHGNWHGVFGTEGSWVAGASPNIPAYVTVTTAAPKWLWGQNPSSFYAPYQQAAGTNRIAACWYSATELDFSFAVNDAQMHRMAMYFLDWTGSGRQERVELIDLATGGVLDARTLTNFTGGVYLTWNITGNVGVRVAPYNVNAVVSAIFFGSPPTAAKFVNVDATTQGNWNQLYGADGSIIARDSARNPPYANVVVRNQSEWTYSSTDSDKRALWKNDGTGRIAGIWYSRYPTTNSFYIDLNLADGGTHRLAVYALDWYNQGRAIQTDVLNSATGEVLDTRQLQSFSSGQYLVWDVKGAIQLRVSTLAGPNAVLSGIFFGPAPAQI